MKNVLNYNQIVSQTTTMDLFKEVPEGIAKIISQEKAVNDCLDYIGKRMRGEIPLYKTRFQNINDCVGGSFEPNSIITIGGVSGSGKSTMATQFIYSFIDNLKAEGKEGVALRFNFEMLAFKTIGREISNIAKKSVGALYSQKEPLSQEEYDRIKKYIIPRVKEKEIFYVEEPETTLGIVKTIYYYWEQLCLIPGKKDKLFIAEIDHVLLVDGDGEEDKEKIDRLMRALVVIKKRIQRQGGFALFIILSQLNRDIESVDRVKVPQMHRPMKKDLSSSDWMYQVSDYVFIGHMPARLNLPYYTERQMPVRIFNNKTDRIEYPFVYYHLLKNRDGLGGQTATMIGNLANFEFIEVSREDLRRYREESQAGKNELFMSDK